jgi:hypothetical protein
MVKRWWCGVEEGGRWRVVPWWPLGTTNVYVVCDSGQWYSEEISCCYVMLVWPLCELSSFMMAFWPLSQIRRLFVQVVGVLCIWDVLTGFACFWGVLVDVSFCEVVNCRVWCCAFLAVARFPCEREFMLVCYTMIWWYFMLLGPLRDFPMSCHAFRPWWDVMRFPHDIWCFVWPPMRLLCFYLMRCYAVFAAQFSGKTSSWDGLRYAISYCWRQLKDCLVRCRSCGPLDEVSSFDSVVVCCPVVS